MKFKIKYNFKGGMSSTSSSSTSSSTSSSVPDENDIILIFLPNKLGEITLQRKRITDHKTGQLNNNPNLTRRFENYKNTSRYGWIFERDVNENQYFKDRYLFPYRIFISFKIPINDDLMNRWSICKTISNQCEIQSPHITLARLEIYNNINLRKLLQKKDIIHYDLTQNMKKTTDQYKSIDQHRTTEQYKSKDQHRTTGQYKILGTKNKALPDHIKDRIFNFHDKDELPTILIQDDDDNTECYLARVFFNGNFSFLYDLIHKNPDLDQNSFLDYNYYNENDYQNFTVHLSLAKFNKISDALSALEAIYNAGLPAGFDNIFTNPHYFNIQIS